MTETMTASSAPATAAPKSSSPQPAKPSSTPTAKSSDGRPELSPLDELKGMLEETPKAETPKPKDKDQGPPEETDTDFQADTPKEPEAKPATERPKPANEGIKTLRTSYEAAKAKLKEYEAEIKTLRESKPKEDPAELLSQLEAEKKARAEAEETLKFVRYEKSKEYTDKYAVPLEKTFKRAYGDITQLTRVDPESGEEVPGRKEDFDAILRMQLGEARKFAKQFGDDASIVLAHRSEILKLHEESMEAINEFRAKGAQREREQSAQQQAAQKRQADEFQKNVKAGEEQFPQWFKAEETDQRGNLMLKKGLDMANRLFAGAQDLEPAERAKFHAACFNYIRGFPYLAAKNHALESRVKELEATVKQYEDSGPAGGTRRNGGANGKETDHDGNPVEGELADAISEIRGLAK